MLPVLTLRVMYFHSAFLCTAFLTLVTASSLSLPSMWLLLPSSLTCSGCPRLSLAVVCSLCSYVLENLIGLWGFLSLHFDYSAYSFFHSWLTSIQQAACVRYPPHPTQHIPNAISPTFPFQVPMHQPLKHWASTLPLQVHNYLLFIFSRCSSFPTAKTCLAQSLSIWITRIPPSHCQNSVTYFQFLQSITNTLAC